MFQFQQCFENDINFDEIFGSTNDLVPTLVNMYDTLLESHKNSSAFLNLHRKEQHNHTNNVAKRNSMRNSVLIDYLSEQMSDLSLLKRYENRSFLYKGYMQNSKSPIGSPKQDTRGNNDDVSRPMSLSSLKSFSSSHSSTNSSLSSSNGSNKRSSSCLTSVESLDSDQDIHERQGSADSGIISVESLPSPEQRILQEILDTESIYVSDLHVVLKGYLYYWKYECDNCPFMDQLPNLFNNLEDIYEFNRKFLEELQNANYDAILIANIFIRNDNGFSVYTTYCTHYPHTMLILGNLMQDEHISKMFRERQISLNHSLPLGAYLLKPVQRILKYHLLLQRLSKELKQPLIDLALTTMTSIALNINHMKRKHEHAVRVQEIQSKLVAWNGADLTTFGELCAEGTFRVNGSKSRRHVFLFDKMFLITKNKSDGSFYYKFHVLNSNLMLVESIRNEPLSFQVLPFDNPRMQCTLNARSAEHKKEWTLQLKRAILENYDAIIPNHARQLVMQLSENMNLEDYNNNGAKSNEKWSPLRHYSVPHYLERRSRFRKSYGATLTSRRSTSQDRSFNLKSAWRRKSDPNHRIVPQHDTKIVPKKPTNLKKTRNHTSKFYINMLLEPEVNNVATKTDTDKSVPTIVVSMDDSSSNKTSSECSSLNNIADTAIKHSKKSESLPRSFQISNGVSSSCLSFGQCSVSNSCETLNITEECPEHKIYRQSIIRFSLIQRFKSIISENESLIPQLDSPTYKQGSKSMGAKIAQPDYADPNKFIRLIYNDDKDSSKNDTITIVEPDIVPELKLQKPAVPPNKPRNLTKKLQPVSKLSSIPVSTNNTTSWVQTVINRFE